LLIWFPSAFADVVYEENAATAIVTLSCRLPQRRGSQALEPNYGERAVSSVGDVFELTLAKVDDVERSDEREIVTLR
jgi:hypothetical protein